MKERIVIALVFLIGAVVTLFYVYDGHISPETSGILANLGTGFIGTAVTVLIVDWLYERRTAQETCRSIAMSVLQELDHAVWVWQGDSRGFDVSELYTRILHAEESDPVPAYVQNLFMRLGTKCVSHLSLKTQDVALDICLNSALKDLARLERIRDLDRGYDFESFKKLLATSVQGLAKACNVAKPEIIALPFTVHRITSEEHQHYRHFGRQLDGTQQPLWKSFD